MSNNFPAHTSFPPYGFNDNSSSVYNQNIPSNIFPYNNPTNTPRINYNKHDYNKVFLPERPLIDPINYTNPNNFLHNNIGPSTLDEFVEEYRINIDSLDRDILVYPDPFNFTVRFAPVGKGIMREPVLVDDYDHSKGTYYREIEVPGTPRPHILKEFRNVKYIKLDSIIMPQCHSVIRNRENKEDKDDYIWDRKFCLTDDRFVTLRIKELLDDTGTRIYSTGDDSSRSNAYRQPFGIIYPDKFISKHYYAGSPYGTYKTYKKSQLGNIKQLTFEFYDSTGTPLKFNNLCCDEKNKDNIRHPLNKYNQVYMSFLIGVVEGQINTNVKLEY